MRGVNSHDGFLRDPNLFLARKILQRAHVMHPVGELHQDYAKVVDHREQHLANALRLAFLARGEIQLAQLGNAVDAARDFFAEGFANVIDLGAGVLYHVVEQAGLQADHVHVHLRKLACHQQRMNHVGLAGKALLLFVPLRGEPVGALEWFQILVGPQSMHQIPEVEIEVLHGVSGLGENFGHGLLPV